MATRTQLQVTIPAYLFVGDLTLTTAHVHDALMNALCPRHGCGTCSTCAALQQHQQSNIRWFVPEKNYTREQLADIPSLLSLTLDPGQQFFFIFESAELLSAACANSLLKSIEEPPPGYHFIFLTQRPQHVLPTITSRCLVQVIGQENNDTPWPEVYALFTTNLKQRNPHTFLQKVQDSAIAESHIVELLDVITVYWLAQYRQALITGNDTNRDVYYKKIRLLQTAYDQLPMPGSSTLFLKNLWLQLGQQD